ncbi:MAG TPA: flagellar export chaperone FliS [Fimbriimonadaceae bacterium]|nr:flagellar export chaperone FliS [Fimbriimonadaceae bacterium]
MAYGRFVQEYQKGAVNGASPIQLVIMLYDGALKFMEAGKHAMLAKDLEKQNQNLQRAQKIVLELMSCLDMQHGADIAKNLLALYSYTLQQLVESNVKDDPEGIDRSIRVFSELRESWVEIGKTVKANAEEQSRAA